MTQSITQIFSNKNSGSGMRGVSDDGGYAKPGSNEHFGASHNNDFGGDFSKLDFDKPLFDYKRLLSYKRNKTVVSFIIHYAFVAAMSSMTIEMMKADLWLK